MRDGSNAAAFFDLDGTLYNNYIWRALRQHHQAHRFKLPSLYVYLGTHIALWPLKNAGLISDEFFHWMWGTHMSWLVRGVSVKRAREIWDWVADQEILPNLRPEMQAAIERHRTEGRRVILLSGTFLPLLQLIAARLEMDGAVGTPLAQRNGRYTGKIVPPLGVGEGKAARLRAYLAGPGQGIDLATSYFYTDAISDTAVLEMVGHPAVVYPDARLAALAAERGWPVIGRIRQERE
ncbi:MAG: HAD-IB family hydrolase [Anaerolineae bacterium]